jgi:cysteinyl-tRNA synthetase
MEWDSPWGKGAPGWHLECSTMSIEYLGERFDPHTGGVDHIPVHHTNEIAQSESYLGGPWVPFWLHNEFLSLDQVKIAKSTGNALRLSDLEQRGYHPLSYRYLLLGGPLPKPGRLHLGWTRRGARRPPPPARADP